MPRRVSFRDACNAQSDFEHAANASLFHENTLPANPFILRRVTGGSNSVVTPFQTKHAAEQKHVAKHVAGEPTFLRRVLCGNTSVVTLAQRRQVTGKLTFLRRVLGRDTSAVTLTHEKTLRANPFF